MSALLLNTVETYQSLQPFKSIEQLNDNTKEIRKQFSDQLTPATKQVLDVLHRYACKYPGLCYLSKSSIAEMIGISRRTVVRSCNTLEKLGVIKQHELKRRNGDRRQSSNAIVFVSVVQEETATEQQCHTVCHTVHTPSKTHLKSSNTYDTGARSEIGEKEVVTESQKKKESNTDSPKLDKSMLKDLLPEGWYDIAMPYAKDYDDLYRITGELFKAKVDTSIRIESYVTEFGAILRSAWANLKHGRINPSKWYAYIFSAFRRKAHALERAESVNPILHDIAALFSDD